MNVIRSRDLFHQGLVGQLLDLEHIRSFSSVPCLTVFITMNFTINRWSHKFWITKGLDDLEEYLYLYT